MPNDTALYLTVTIISSIVECRAKAGISETRSLYYRLQLTTRGECHNLDKDSKNEGSTELLNRSRRVQARQWLLVHCSVAATSSKNHQCEHSPHQEEHRWAPRKLLLMGHSPWPWDPSASHCTCACPSTLRGGRTWWCLEQVSVCGCM